MTALTAAIPDPKHLHASPCSRAASFVSRTSTVGLLIVGRRGHGRLRHTRRLTARSISFVQHVELDTAGHRGPQYPVTVISEEGNSMDGPKRRRGAYQHVGQPRHPTAERARLRSGAQAWMSGFSNCGFVHDHLDPIRCLTLFGFGMFTGGPASSAYGWLVVGFFVTVRRIGHGRGLLRATLTAGGLYYWSAKL